MAWTAEVTRLAAAIAKDGLNFVSDGPAIINLVNELAKELPAWLPTKRKLDQLKVLLDQLDDEFEWISKNRVGESDQQRELRESQTLGLYVDIWQVAKSRNMI